MRHSEDNDPEPPDEPSWDGIQNLCTSHPTSTGIMSAMTHLYTVKLRGMTHRHNETATAQRQEWRLQNVTSLRVGT